MNRLEIFQCILIHILNLCPILHEIGCLGIRRLIGVDQQFQIQLATFIFLTLFVQSFRLSRGFWEIQPSARKRHTLGNRLQAGQKLRAVGQGRQGRFHIGIRQGIQIGHPLRQLIGCIQKLAHQLGVNCLRQLIVHFDRVGFSIICKASFSIGQRYSFLNPFIVDDPDLICFPDVSLRIGVILNFKSFFSSVDLNQTVAVVAGRYLIGKTIADQQTGA